MAKRSKGIGFRRGPAVELRGSFEGDKKKNEGEKVGRLGMRWKILQDRPVQ